MSEKKVNVIEEINRKLLNMNEQEKSYLMGFLEGFAAMAGVGELMRRKTPRWAATRRGRS